MRMRQTEKNAKGSRRGRILALGMAAGLLLFGGMSAAAAESSLLMGGWGHHGSYQGHHKGHHVEEICGARCAFVDEDGDGICDICSFSVPAGIGAPAEGISGTEALEAAENLQESTQQENGAVPGNAAGTYYGHGCWQNGYGGSGHHGWGHRGGHH